MLRLEPYLLPAFSGFSEPSVLLAYSRLTYIDPHRLPCSLVPFYHLSTHHHLRSPQLIYGLGHEST